MLLEYGALIAVIYFIMFAPIVGGDIWMFNRPEKWMKIAGILTIIATILVIIVTIHSVKG